MFFSPLRVAGFSVCLAFGYTLLRIIASLDDVGSSKISFFHHKSGHHLYPPFPPPNLDAVTEPLDLQDAELASASKLLWASRALSIKEAFLHAYSGYMMYAPFPADELRPLSNSGIANLNGWGVTIVDSLDTMLLMGLDQQFNSAIANISAIDFTMPLGKQVPFFETTIRYIGGFLSAYAFSNETILLSLAERLATQLLPAFKTQSGLPAYSVDTRTNSGARSMTPTAYLAEIGSCQMEFKYLSRLTGRSDFFNVAEKVMDALVKVQSTDNHMWPTVFSVVTGSPSSDVFSMGALADSAYEYLLKQYLLSNQTETKLAELYMSSMSGVIDNLLYLSPDRQLLYVTDVNGRGDPSGRFEHLSCFLPGLLALGANTLPDSVMSSAQRELHMWAAEGLGHSCWLMYAERPSGLGPENVWVKQWFLQEQELQGKENRSVLIREAKKRGRWMTHVDEWNSLGRPGDKPPGLRDPVVMDTTDGDLDYYIGQDTYLLRPETLESIFVLYRTTGDPKWRDRGWQIWDSIARNTRTSSGFATAIRLNSDTPVLEDSMPSYFLAETVKYAYLLALDQDLIPMSSFVLNTEAHPFPIFDWRDWEKKTHRIKS